MIHFLVNNYFVSDHLKIILSDRDKISGYLNFYKGMTNIIFKATWARHPFPSVKYQFF